MIAFDTWRAAVIKLLKSPKAESVAHKHWVKAYINDLTHKEAATEIDRIWYNATRPKTKRTPSKRESRKMGRKLNTK